MDRDKLKAFAVELMGFYGGAAVAQMVDLGARTGLTEALATGPATSAELADRAGCVERYVREWLHGLTTAGVVEHDPESGRFTLPLEHAACLTGGHFYNTSAMARALTNGNRNNDRLATAFTDGGGIPYTEQDPQTVEVLDAMGRSRYDTFLVSRYVTVDETLHRTLQDGATVCDVGCGSGHVVTLLAEAFPASTFVGVDSNPEAITAARAEADATGLSNARFEVSDAAALEPASFDVVTTFDVIHDLPHPHETLAAIHAALRPGGTYLMYDAAAPARLEDQVGLPWAPMMYGISLNACIANAMTGDGDALGPMWPRAEAEEALRSAGFEIAGVHDVPGDPMNALYVSRR